MSNLAAYLCFGIALAFVIVAGVLSVRAGLRWWFGSEKGNPRL
jgi:hypothetical protein